MKPYYEQDGITIYHGDCLDLLPFIGAVDAVVTDPPYGISFVHGGNDRGGIGKGRYATKFAGVEVRGDEAPFDPSPFLSIADTVILWGANHFADRLPASSSWLVWDKRAASHHTNDFADCELAWTNRKGVARVFRHQWDGMMKASERGIERFHPTQKPIALMCWCIGQIANAQTILDPYIGSGTTLVAAKRLGCKAIGIEIEERYCEIAATRLSQSVLPFADLPTTQEASQMEFAQ